MKRSPAVIQADLEELRWVAEGLSRSTARALEQLKVIELEIQLAEAELGLQRSTGPQLVTTTPEPNEPAS